MNLLEYGRRERVYFWRALILASYMPAEFSRTSGQSWWAVERESGFKEPEWFAGASSVLTRGFAICVISIVLAQVLVAVLVLRKGGVSAQGKKKR